MDQQRRRWRFPPQTAATTPIIPGQVHWTAAQLPGHTVLVFVLLILLQFLPCQTNGLEAGPTIPSQQRLQAHSPTPSTVTTTTVTITIPSREIIRQLSTMDLDQPETNTRDDNGDEADKKGPLNTPAVANLVPGRSPVTTTSPDPTTEAHQTAKGEYGETPHDTPHKSSDSLSRHRSTMPGPLEPEASVDGPPPGVDNPAQTLQPVNLITTTSQAPASTSTFSSSIAPGNGRSSSSPASASTPLTASSVVTSSSLPTSSTTSSVMVSPRAPSSITQIGNACGPTLSFVFNFSTTTTNAHAAHGPSSATHPPADSCEVTATPWDTDALEAAGRGTTTPTPPEPPSPASARSRAAAAHLVSSSSSAGIAVSQGCKQVILRGLLSATPYVMKVVAVISGIAGTGIRKSEPVYFNFTTASKSVGVDGLRVLAVTSNSAALTWRPWTPWFDESVLYRVQIKTSATCSRYVVPTDRSDKFPAAVLPQKNGNGHSIDRYTGPQGSGCSMENWNYGPFDGQLTIARLQACTTYDVIVTSYCYCSCNASNVVSFTTLSNVPQVSGLTVRSNSSSTVTVLWSVSMSTGMCGVVSYRLTLLNAADDSVITLHVTNATLDGESKNGNESYIFSKLLSYGQYKVRVEVGSTGGMSSGVTSDVVRTQPSRPGKVGNLQAADVEGSNGQSMNLTWNPPSYYNGALVMYMVRLRLSKDGPCVAVFHVLPSGDKGGQKDPMDEGNDRTPCAEPVKSYSNLTSPHLIINDLLPDTDYSVNITVVNSFGPGHFSIFTIRTPIAVPSAPTDFKAVEVTSTTVKLSWIPPDPRPGPTQYEVHVIDLGSPYQGEPMEGGERSSPCSSQDSDTALSCTVSDLQSYWRYKFSLTAQTEKGVSPPAVLDQLVLTQTSAPGPVQTVQVRAVTGNYTDVIVTWACPTLNQRHTNITRFAVRAVLLVDAKNNSTGEAVYIASDNCDHDLSAVMDVVPEREYVFQVLSLSGDDNATQWSDSPRFKATIGPSSAVSHLTVTPASTSVTVTWDPPDQPNGRIIAYLITLTNDSAICFRDRIVWDSSVEQKLITSDCLSHDADVNHEQTNVVIGEADHHVQTLDGLRAETRVNVTVTPFNHYGAGQSSSQSVLLEPGTSEPVSSLSVVSTTATGVTLEWSAPTVTNGHLLKYGVLVGNRQRPCIRWLDVLLQGVDLAQMPVVTDGSDVDCPAFNKNNFTVAPGDPLKVTVTDLFPADNVTVTVYPFNRAGWGLSRSVTALTEETVPNAPRHPHVNFVNATFLWISWKPPVPRPGRTTYELDISRAKSDDPFSGQFQHVRYFTLEGWNTTGVGISDLWSGWRYSITLTAATSKGSKKIQLSQPIIMPEAPPGNVQNFAVVPAEDDYGKLVVKWDYPALEERHGRIVNFTISYLNDKAHAVVCLATDCLCSQGSTQFCVSLPVVPGERYTLTIAANNQFPGAESEQTYRARTGPPPPISEVPTTPPSAPASQSMISVTYCAACLLDDSNGAIIYLALLVCPAEHGSTVNMSNLRSQSALQQLPSWYDANANDFKLLYRPTDEDWATRVRAMVARSRRSSDGQTDGHRYKQAVYVVGQDAKCAQQPGTSHCNGPLPAGRAFRVMTVTCTENSCTTSALSEPLYTLDVPNDSISLSLIVIGCVLGVATGCLVVVVIIWYRRNRAVAKSPDKGDESNEGVEMMPPQNKSSIPMQEFEDRLREWKATPSPESSLPLTLVEQFREIRALSPKHECSAAKMDDNRMKNRYCDILPFDHTRVKLIELDDDITTDYINANYLPGFTSKREYIATQGPLEGTVNDFWRMVWETGSPVIVMLSGLKEGRLSKVYKYFPDENHMHKRVIYDMVEVTLQDVSQHEHYLVRTFKMVVGDRSRKVKQFYVFDWKDFDANLTANLVLDFVRAVRHAVPEDNKRPLIVHCSAGVGRTGTWIAIDYFMHYIRAHPLSAPIDIFKFVLTLREARPIMVQAAEQYVFIHDVVGELIRRKMEVDRYDEPVYVNVSQIQYTNKGYDHDDDDYANLQDVESSVSSSTNSPATSSSVKHKSPRSTPRGSRSSKKSSGKRNEKTETSRM